MARAMVPHDGNSACAHVAHAVNEVIAIYPITPSSPLGELSDEKSAKGEKNIWGAVPLVSQLQSEAGASGAVHGALSAGSVTTTFTGSQGLLLMIPNMYKIAGELLPTAFHVTSRSLACQALSIFGDHSDITAVRETGFGLLSSSSVQEAMDLALIVQAATLESRVPFVHFYEGFRVSHEIQKIEELTKEDMRAMIDDSFVQAYRERSMSPERPIIRGTSQNPDVYFQGRETVNKYYNAATAIVQKAMDRFAEIVGRSYKLFEYYGPSDAERVIVIMGSGSQVVNETVDYMNKNGNEKVGMLQVRLYRPWDTTAFVKALPASVSRISVLDRTKEPGAVGEPLYEDVCTAIDQAIAEGTAPFSAKPMVVGGRYGLGSAEFTPAMVKGVFDDLAKDTPKNHYTIGIDDDVTHTSLEFDASVNIEREDTFRGLFYGLGSDGTVGANKNSIKIIAKETDNYAQGYFVYDAKKAGAVTVSHLRFSPQKIKSPYLISNANFIACHNFSFLPKYDMLKDAVEGGVFLLNSPYPAEQVWEKLPGKVQQQIIDKKLQFYVIDAVDIAGKIGLGGRINVIMQTAFFLISDIMDKDHAINAIKDAIKKTYGKKGEKIVDMNNQAVDAAQTHIEKVEYPSEVTNEIEELKAVPDDSPDFVKNVTQKILKKEGDKIKVSEMPEDGSWPLGTTKYEKRNIAINVPVWNPDTCIQCGRCSILCPHGVIRPKVYDASELDNAPAGFKSTDAKGKGMEGKKYTLQVSVEDCTGCSVCATYCPAAKKEALTMHPIGDVREKEVENWKFFESLPETDPSLYEPDNMKGSQFITPQFEFSGACAGCGETMYVKLMSQLFGSRALIANATGCSSIYGGNLPTTPYTPRKDGRGPTWNNSLFEDAAELAFGMRLSVDKQTDIARITAQQVLENGECGAEVKKVLGEILEADQSDIRKIEQQIQRIDSIKPTLAESSDDTCKRLAFYIDYLAKKSVWGMGGDGWAYDIGYGGVDHVLASGLDINLLVMDTEVYSNTGGQSSKATPMGAVAKFAASGKPTLKKDLGLISITYGNIYVARIAMGANPNQAVKAMIEAEAYEGPSLVLCYAHCIAHGVPMVQGNEQQKKAVASGHWPLYRYNPLLAKEGKNPLTLDSKEPSIPISEYISNENRYKILQRSNPERAQMLMEQAQQAVNERFQLYKTLASM